MNKKTYRTNPRPEAIGGLDLVIEFLEEVGERPEAHGLTPGKIDSRAERVHDPDHPDWICFDIPRHHAVLGCIYRKGLAMNACVEVRYRYAFDPAQKNLHDLGPVTEAKLLGSVAKAAEEFVEDLDFRCEFLPDGRICCSEAWCGEQVVAADEQQVVSFAREQADGLNYDDLRSDLLEWLSEFSAEKIIREFKDACRQAAVEKVRKALEDYEAGEP